MEEFHELGVQVVGASVDSLRTQQKFAAKHDLRFPLIADEDRRISAAYGVLRSPEGRTDRDTVVISRDGTVVLTYERAKASGHAAQVLTDIKEALASGKF